MEALQRLAKFAGDSVQYRVPLPKREQVAGTAGARRSVSQCARTANFCCYTCNRRSEVRWSYGTLSSFS